MGAAYRPAGAGDHDNVDFRKQFLEQRDKKNMEEAEDVDVNAAIHGEKILLYHPKRLKYFLCLRNDSNVLSKLGFPM